jgi:O-Antigen ligase
MPVLDPEAGTDEAWWRDAVLAFGLLLSAASQLRIGSLPIGPGELCLLIWICAHVYGAVFRSPIVLPPAAGRILAFWVFFAGTQSLGLLTGLALKDHQDQAHIVLAFSIVAAVSSLCLARSNASEGLRRTACLVTRIGGVSLACQIASGLLDLRVPGLDGWYWDRFRGWSDNPNQLSLLCTALVLIAAYAAETAFGRRERLVLLLWGTPAVVAGLMTKGNSFRLALVVALAAFTLAKLRRFLVGGYARAPYRFTVAVLAIGLAVPLGLAGALLLHAVKLESVAKDISRDADQTLDEAAVRVYLWGGAIQKGFDSYFLGLGPPSHVPVPPEVVARQKWARTETEAGLGSGAEHGESMESHNTYLELFSQGGLPLLLGFVALMLSTIRQSYRPDVASLTAMIASLMLFSVFHVTLRHPIVWFCICLVQAGPRRLPGRHAASGRSPRRLAPVTTGTAPFASGAFGPPLIRD